jgi:hypothetical protein
MAILKASSHHGYLTGAEPQWLFNRIRATTALSNNSISATMAINKISTTSAI